MRWLIDFDTTLSNTFVEQIKKLNERFNTSYILADFTDWELSNLSTEEAQYMWSEHLFLNHEFQRSCPPVEGALERMRQLQKISDYMCVVSDRPLSLYDVTREWLDTNELNGVDLILTSSRHTTVEGDRPLHTKSRIAYYKRLNMVVEDSPHNSIYLADRSYINKVYLIDTPSNQGVEHEKIQRITSWREVV